MVDGNAMTVKEEYSAVPPSSYAEPTPIYTRCIQESNVHASERWRLAYADLDRHGYAGPEKGWMVQ